MARLLEFGRNRGILIRLWVFFVGVGSSAGLGV